MLKNPEQRTPDEQIFFFLDYVLDVGGLCVLMSLLLFCFHGSPPPPPLSPEQVLDSGDSSTVIILFFKNFLVFSWLQFTYLTLYKTELNRK